MKKIKGLLVAIFTTSLVACGGSDFTIIKPSTKGFQSEDSPVQRYIGYFSAEDMEKMDRLNDELLALGSVNPNHYRVNNVIPSLELIPSEFKHGDGTKITEEYKIGLNNYIQAKQEAENEYQRQLSDMQKELDSATITLTEILKKYPDFGLELIKLIKEREIISKNWRASKDKYDQVTYKISYDLSNLLSKNFIPIYKEKLGASYTNYFEGTCSKLGLNQEDLSTYYTFQYDETLCVSKDLPNTTYLYELPTYYQQDENFILNLEKNIRIQTDMRLEQGLIKLKDRTVNGYQQQIASIDEKFKLIYDALQRKLHRADSRELYKVKRNYDSKKGNLDIFVKRKTEFITNQTSTIFSKQSERLSPYVTAVREYGDTFLTNFLQDKLEKVKGAEYSEIVFDAREGKSIVIVLDIIEAQKKLEIYALRTNELTTYIEENDANNTLRLEDIYKADFISMKKTRYSKKMDLYDGVNTISRRNFRDPL